MGLLTVHRIATLHLKRGITANIMHNNITTMRWDLWWLSSFFGVKTSIGAEFKHQLFTRNRSLHQVYTHSKLQNKGILLKVLSLLIYTNWICTLVIATSHYLPRQQSQQGCSLVTAVRVINPNWPRKYNSETRRLYNRLLGPCLSITDIKMRSLIL